MTPDLLKGTREAHGQGPGPPASYVTIVAMTPPSAKSTDPVMNSPASEASRRLGPTMSSGVPHPPIGTRYAATS